MTVNYPCSLTTGTSCTIDGAEPGQSEVRGIAFNDGYAYLSGYSVGSGIAICTIEPSGILDQCAISPSLQGYYGGMAFH